MENLRSPEKIPVSVFEPAIAPRVLGGLRRTPLPSLRLGISERRVVLALFDVLVLNLALWVSIALRMDQVKHQLHYYVLLTVLWVAWATFFDCYELPRAADASQSVWSAGRAGLLTALSYLAIPFYTPQFPASRLSSALFVGLVIVSLSAWRAVYAVLFNQSIFQQRVLVVGAGRSGRKMADLLTRAPERGNPYSGSGYRLVGFVDDDPTKLGTEVEGKPVLGDCHDLAHLVQAYDIDLLVVAIVYATAIQPELFQALLDCRERGVDVERVTDFYERLTGRILVEHAGRNLSVVMPVPDSATQHVFLAAKRLLDLLVGLCGLVVMGLIAPCIALANALFCPGPLLYRQVRVGKGGRPFEIVKFRSMVPAAEQDCGATWACEDDDRVTPVGRLLRKTRLDEVPQCWNILKGEMSLVGPRPERPEFVDSQLKELPFYQARHAVRPGITGWAQVRYRYGSSVEDALIKLEYDLYYIRRQGVYLELSILVKTVAVILGLKGR